MRTPDTTFVSGEVLEVPYPFFRAANRWHPGKRRLLTHTPPWGDWQEWVTDGEGLRTLMIIDTHQPAGSTATYVYFRQAWSDPDGVPWPSKEPDMRVISMSMFQQLLKDRV